MKSHISSLFALVLALSVLSPVAQAQSAEVLIQQGLQLRRQHRDAEALQHFQDAHALNQSAQALAQIALAEQALGSYVEAETHLQQALSLQGDVWIGSRAPQLQQALAQISAQLGTVEISGAIPGAIVLVNGVERGTFPEAAQLRMRAGSAVVEIRAQGYLPVQRTVVVMSGGIARESIQLIAAQGQPAPQPQGQDYPQQQPQPGYAVQPQYATYQQPQTQFETEPNMRLFWIGLPLFAAPWVLTWALTLTIDDGATDATGYSFIPLVGPFLMLENNDDFFATVLIIDGLAQIAGATLMVLGLVTTREVEVRAELGNEPDAPVLTFRPLAGQNYVGGSLTLTHF